MPKISLSSCESYSNKPFVSQPFSEPGASHKTQSVEAGYSIRKPVRKIVDFELDGAIFSDPGFKRVTRLHGHPLSRRIGFGLSTNTFVTVLLDFNKCSNQILMNQITLVPTVEAYLVNYLKSKNRGSEFDKLVQTRVLCMKPPSEFLRLIDTYLFDHLSKFFRTGRSDLDTRKLQYSINSGHRFPLNVINEKMQRFCATICQNMNDVRFGKLVLAFRVSQPGSLDNLQRSAFLDWLRDELKEELDMKIESLKISNRVSPYAAVFYCLHYGFVERAVEVAAENGLFQLSMFIGNYLNGRVPTRFSKYSQEMVSF